LAFKHYKKKGIMPSAPSLGYRTGENAKKCKHFNGDFEKPSKCLRSTKPCHSLFVPVMRKSVSYGLTCGLIYLDITGFHNTRRRIAKNFILAGNAVTRRFMVPTFACAISDSLQTIKFAVSPFSRTFNPSLPMIITSAIMISSVIITLEPGDMSFQSV